MQPAGPIIAHRGASAICPENTLASLQRAVADGCAWAEIDAQVMADGAVIVMHDHDFDRTTNGQGPVAMQDLGYARGLRTRHPEGAVSDERIPLLTEVLEYCGQSGLGLVLEIKATWGVDAEDAAAVAALLPPAPTFPLMVTSFSVSALQAMAELRPDIPLGLAVLRPPVDPAATKARLNLSAVHCNADFTTAEDIAKMREAGLDVAIATINDAQRAQRFLDKGAHGIMTDLPRLLQDR